MREVENRRLVTDLVDMTSARIDVVIVVALTINCMVLSERFYICMAYSVKTP